MERRFTDGTTRPLYRSDGGRQYVRGDDGQRRFKGITRFNKVAIAWRKLVHAPRPLYAISAVRATRLEFQRISGNYFAD